MKITKALQATAYHEAGHAVAAWYLGAGVKSASIVPDADSTGRVYYERHPLEGIDIDLDDGPHVQARLEDAIQIALAGPVAHRRFNPRSWRHHHGEVDHRVATDLALKNCGSAEIASAYLKYLGLLARGIVKTNWVAVEALAEELLERRAMSGEDVEEVIRAAFRDALAPE